jgi:predicted enzyme related to lactoylglutathione lyase
MVVKKVGLSWFAVKDIQKAKKFFSQTLGLQLTVDTPEYSWLELAGEEDFCSMVGIGEAKEMGGHKPPIAPGQNAMITFVVDDIVEAKKELESKGVRFVDEIMEVPGHVKMVTFVDEDGNHFQLVEDLDEGGQACCEESCDECEESCEEACDEEECDEDSCC